MSKERFSSLPTIRASLGTGDCQHIACEATNNRHTTVILYTVDINRLQIQKIKRQATERLIRVRIIVQGVRVNPYTGLGLLKDRTGITGSLNSGIQIIKLQTGHRKTPSHQLICLFYAPMHLTMYGSNHPRHDGSRY